MDMLKHIWRRVEIRERTKAYKPKQTQQQLNNSSVFTGFKLVHRGRKSETSLTLKKKSKHLSLIISSLQEHTLYLLPTPLYPLPHYVYSFEESRESFWHCQYFVSHTWLASRKIVSNVFIHDKNPDWPVVVYCYILSIDFNFRLNT